MKLACLSNAAVGSRNLVQNDDDYVNYLIVLFIIIIINHQDKKY